MTNPADPADRAEKKTRKKDGKNGVAGVAAAVSTVGIETLVETGAGPVHSGDATVASGTPSTPSVPGVQSAPSPAPGSAEAEHAPAMSDLPDDIQTVLAQFRDQVGQAPPAYQQMIASYLFPSDPSRLVQEAKAQVQVAAQAPQAPQVPQVKPAPASAQPVSAPTTVPTATASPSMAPTRSAGDAGYGQAPGLADAQPESPIIRTFPRLEALEGFQQIPSVLLYSFSANGYRPLRGLVVDVVQWGGKMVLIMLCKEVVLALTAEGTIENVPTKTPFAVPVDTDISNIVRPIVEDPTGAYEVIIPPTSIQRGSDGQPILRFRPLLGVRIVKATVWPPK